MSGDTRPLYSPAPQAVQDAVASEVLCRSPMDQTKVLVELLDERIEDALSRRDEIAGVYLDDLRDLRAAIEVLTRELAVKDEALRKIASLTDEQIEVEGWSPQNIAHNALKDTDEQEIG